MKPLALFPPTIFFCKEEDNLPGTSDSVEDMQDGILIQ